MGRHKSMNKDERTVIDFLYRLPAVTKVVCGVIESIRHKYGSQHLKIAATTLAGFRMKLYSPGAVRELYVSVP